MKKLLKCLVISLFAFLSGISLVNIPNVVDITHAEGVDTHVLTPGEELGGDDYLWIYFEDYDGSLISKIAVADEYEITVVDNIYCDAESLEPIVFTGDLPVPSDRIGYNFKGYDKDPYSTCLYAGIKNVFNAVYEAKLKLTINYRVKTDETYGLKNEFFRTEPCQKTFYYDSGDEVLNKDLESIISGLNVLNEYCDYTFLSFDAIPDVIDRDYVLNANYVKNGLVTLKYYTQLVFDYAENINLNFLAYLTVQKLIPIGNEIDVNLFNTHEKVFKKYDDSLSFYNNVPHVKFLNWDKDLIVNEEELVIHGNYEMPKINVRYIDSAGEFVDEISYDFEWFTIDEINTGKFIDYRDLFNEILRYGLSFKFGDMFETIYDAEDVSNYLNNVANYDTDDCRIITGFCLPSCQIEGMYKGLLGYGSLEWNKRYMWYVEGTPENNDYKFLIDPEAYCSELFVPSITCTFENALDKSVYRIGSFFGAIGDFFVGVGEFFGDVWDWIVNNWYWVLLFVVLVLVVIVVIKLIQRYL